MRRLHWLGSVAAVLFLVLAAGTASAVDIGVFYYPGWRSDSMNWNDLRGLPGSRSPGLPWPDREPLLGYYPEEELWVAEKHIEWASRFGIDFFTYDWYWNGLNPVHTHALDNYLRAGNKSKIRFCLLWANHDTSPQSPADFDAMVGYWIDHYFNQPTYYRIDERPVIFLFSYDHLDAKAKKIGETIMTLLKRANSKAQSKGLKGIYFVLTANGMPNNELEDWLRQAGFAAYTAWNYAETKGGRIADYNLMVDVYLEYYRAAAKTRKRIPYIVPASPGWDSRPWSGSGAVVRNDPTPEKFERMLLGAKKLLDDPMTAPKVLMIEAWNEFGEGSYVEPTKKWGYRYLETIRKVFKP